MGKGHGFFFYNKIIYISRRFIEILQEMKRRGYQTNFTSLDLQGIPMNLFSDYQPTKRALEINIERILERMSDKPHLYTHRDQKVNFQLIHKDFLSNSSNFISI